MNEEEKNSSKHKTSEWLLGKVFNLSGTVEAWLTDEYLAFVFIYSEGAEPRPVLLSRSRFDDEAHAREWAERILTAFQNELPKVLEFEAERHLINITNFALSESGLIPVPVEDIIEAQAKEQRTVLRARFNLTVGSGRFSKWSKADLYRVLYEIVYDKPALPWDSINAEIARRHPGRESKSGNSLRETARKFGLSLRQIRADVNKKRKMKR